MYRKLISVNQQAHIAEVALSCKHNVDLKCLSVTLNYWFNQKPLTRENNFESDWRTYPQLTSTKFRCYLALFMLHQFRCLWMNGLSSTSADCLNPGFKIWVAMRWIKYRLRFSHSATRRIRTFEECIPICCIIFDCLSHVVNQLGNSNTRVSKLVTQSTRFQTNFL